MEGQPDVPDSERLQELERKVAILGHITAAGRVGVWEWDPEKGETTWDPAMREIAGIDQSAEVSTDLWLSLVHPDDQEAAREATDERHENGELQHRIVRPDGQVRHVIVRSEPLDPDLETSGLMGLVIDVTESQKTPSLIVDILESISDAYLGVGHDWRFTYANRQAELLLGRPRTELLGENLWGLYPDVVDSPFEKYRIVMEDRKPVQLEEFYEPLGMWFEIRAFPVESGIAIYFRDATDRHQAEEERKRMLKEAQAARKAAEHRAKYDSLTGLLNRTELMRQLDAALLDPVPITLLFFDIDRFKLVNDSRGHAFGDKMLRAVADRLVPFRDGGNLVARFGGDEFVIGLRDWDHVSASALAERVLSEIRKPFELDGKLNHATASIGLADSQGGIPASEILLNADVALYRAKETGRDRAIWFDEPLRTRLLRRVDLEHRLRKAIEDDLIRFDFQPAFQLSTGRATDAEALARWEDLHDGEMSPGEFIPIAEDSGLIHRIGRSAVQKAAEAGAGWNRQAGEPITFWANVSAEQLVRPDAAFSFRTILDNATFDPSCFGVEITESALAENSNILDGLRAAADLGIKIAIDDFGTGYSSISRLSELPVDVLKIDRSFIEKIEDPGGIETIAAIVDLGHALGATVIAEGIDSEAQLDLVRLTRCDRASGFLLARPVPIDRLADAVEAGERLLRDTGSRTHH